MKPYYEHAGITIYHGDCREILPALPKCDLLLTDPPYGIGLPCNFNTRKRGGLSECRRDYPPVFGDEEPFDPAHLLALDIPTVLFGGNYFANKLPPSGGWFFWDKFRPDGLDESSGEMAWTNFVEGVRIFRHLWNGMMVQSERGEHYHPTQKPVALMKWILTHRWTPAGSVLDPYMGSGPVLIAAKDLGRTAIGIEIEERYCEIAVRRLSQEVLPFASPGNVERATLNVQRGTFNFHNRTRLTEPRLHRGGYTMNRKELRPSGRRVNATSWWRRPPMNDELRAQLWAMEEAGIVRREMVVFLREHGIRTGEPKLTEFFKPALREQYEIAKAAGAADVLARAVADAGDLAAGGQAVVAKAFFDLIRGASNGATPEGQALMLNAAQVFSQMQKTAYDTARLKLKQQDIGLGERRVAVLEKRLEEAKTAVESQSLSAEEARARIKEIFQKA